MAVAALSVVALWRFRETRRPQVMRGLAIGVVVAVAVGAPLLAALGRDILRGEVDRPNGFTDAGLYSTDLLSWVLPHPGHPLWGAHFRGIYERATGHERFAYIGVVILVLAGVGLVRAKGKRGLWGAMAATFFVLALGPGLRVNGHTGSAFASGGFRFSIPLPFLALEQVPGVTAFRAPARFAAVAGLALIILAALGLEALVSKRTKPTAAILVAIACVALVVDELPTRNWLLLPTRLDPYYAQMATDPARGAVLDLPLQFRSGSGPLGGGSIPPLDHSRFMYAATVHGRPMVGGSVSRIPESRLIKLRGVDVYHDLLALQSDVPSDQDIDLGNVTAAVDFTAVDLACLGIRYVVYHLESPNPVAAAYLSTLGLREVRSSETVTIWRVDGAADPQACAAGAPSP